MGPGPTRRSPPLTHRQFRTVSRAWLRWSSCRCRRLAAGSSSERRSSPSSAPLTAAEAELGEHGAGVVQNSRSSTMRPFSTRVKTASGRCRCSPVAGMPGRWTSWSRCRRLPCDKCPGARFRCRHPKVEAGVESPVRRPATGTSARQRSRSRARARSTAAVRFGAPSLSRMWVMCFFTVLSET